MTSEYAGPISATSRHARDSLKDYAMGYPGATEHRPWGEFAIKINGKVFVFLSAHAKGFNVSCKLPVGRADALDLPYAEPTGYGLGKSGWVSAHFEPHEAAPLDVMKKWIEESYRAIAPTKWVAALDGGPMPAAKPAKPKREGKKPARGSAKRRSRT